MINLSDCFDKSEKAIIQKLLLLAHPVGSYYWSTDSTDPAKLFGGSWEQIKDKFIYAVGSKGVNATGGEENHILTVNETPAHTHTRGTMNITGSWSTNWNKPVRGFHELTCSGAFYRTTDKSKPGRIAAQDDSANNSATNGYPNFDASRNWTGATSSVGGNASHNNMPPYICAYCWRRIK